MPTVINNPPPQAPPPQRDPHALVGLIVGIIVIIALMILFFVYVLPAIRDIIEEDGTNIEISEQIDINVNPQQ